MNTGWKTVKLGEIVAPVQREEKVDAAQEYSLLGVRLDGNGAFLREKITGTQTAAAKLYRVAKDDFIYSRLFACRGAFATITDELDNCYVSSEFPTFVPIQDKIDVNFLKYWFRLPTVIASVDADCSGSTPLTRNRYKKKFFLALKIPLPTLCEQRRIVARIEELFAQINEASGLRKQATEEALTLSRSITEVAFNKLRDKFGTTPLGNVCESITDSDHNTPKFSDKGIRFIFVGNVSSGKLHFQGTKFVDKEYFESITPKRVPGIGDILYSAVGATLGVPAVVDKEESFCFQRHIAILKLNQNIVNSSFVWHMLGSWTVVEKAWASTTGTAQPTIPLRAIRKLSVPVPPLSEQRRIVAELDALQTEVDALKRLQAETASELDALLPAVLDRAFKGEL